MDVPGLEQEARLIARGLIAAGVGRGDRVAVWATNVPEWIVLQFALAKAGAVLVTVNTSLRAREIEYLLRQSETSTLVTIAGFRGVDYMAEFREARPATVKQVFFVGEPCPPDATPYEQLRAMAERVSERELDERESTVGVDDVINMQYTSGTTGFPKGRDAVQPQHRQQRLLDWRRSRLHTVGSALPVRAAVSLFRLRAGSAGRVYARRLPVSDRSLRSGTRARNSRSRKMHVALRRADDVPCRARASGVRSLPDRFAQDGDHGRRAVPGAADAARDRSRCTCRN